jgi:hypothetical protein
MKTAVAERWDGAGRVALEGELDVPGEASLDQFAGRDAGAEVVRAECLRRGDRGTRLGRRVSATSARIQH